MSEHDNDPLAEQKISSEVVYQGNFLTVRRDLARLPDGARATREYVAHPGAAIVLPVFDDQTVLIERQYRYPQGRSFIEFPAGKIDPGEVALATAVRELREETGYSAARLGHLTTVHPTIGYSNERMELFVARDLTPGPAARDAGEFLELRVVTLGWLVDELMAGRLTDAKTQLGVFWLERLFDGRVPWPADARLAAEPQPPD
jgi:ADP-ribose pyrophosphatase